ncbi:hypothetical protein LC612_34930 [Nostoc sp. CHAB 5834]|nr:hypothetical protein [Nostoc sp. CHAB 5834]
MAVENEVKVLKVLRMFGHLRRQEIALAVWPRSSPTSAYVMACRTVSRMLKGGLVLDKSNSLGGNSLVLAAKGVAVLRNHHITAQEGYDLAFDGPQFYHRTLGTCYLLEKAKAGAEVFGEFALLKDWAPVHKEILRERLRKLPDGLIAHPKGSFGYGEDIRPVDWIEVESSYKPYEEVKKALSVFMKSPELNKEGTVIFNRMVFVYNSRQKHEQQILRYIKQFLKEHSHLSADMVLPEIIFARCSVNFPFVWGGMAEYTAQQLLNAPDGITDDPNLLNLDDF